MNTPVDATILSTLPGHQIRRLHQIAVAIFLQEGEGHGLTPVQYAALHGVALQPGIDQRTLAGTAGLDTSTVAGVIDRLEARGLLQRQASVQDRRVRQLTLTLAGQALLEQAAPAIQATQQRLLQPLSQAEQTQFVLLLNRLVEANNELSRAPVP